MKNARWSGLPRQPKDLTSPSRRSSYNDENPDKIYYQGLAWRALGDEEKARERFSKLIEHGEKHLDDECENRVLRGLASRPGDLGKRI